MPVLPDFDVFRAAYEAGKSALLWSWVPADLETPVSAFLKLCGHEHNALLLESVEGGAVLGRYSVIGFAPDIIWSHDGKDSFLNGQKTDAPALQSLRTLVAASRIDDVPQDLPPMAASGLFGYMGYDMIRLVEAIPDENPDTLGIPEGIFIRPTIMAIFDNIKHMICLVTAARPVAAVSARRSYDEAAARLGECLEKLARPVNPALLTHESTLETPLEVSANMSREDFHGMVRRAIEDIRAGEIFQVVLSQRFTAPFDLPAFELYRTLRRINPSPFLFYVNLSGFALVGSSPEILVRVRSGTVTIRPIAGTRPRGASPEEDRRLAAELLADPKERAEHLMLLDLGRNDVGRVAQIGSVRVTEQFAIEHYSHVMHIVSNVEGTLRADLDALDALLAGFPAGTVSGAPKVRAMEIIDELEPVRRSFYAGCVGYISGNGDLDTCIALRTALVKDGKLYAQAGGGIVADSDPEFEYQESLNKARAILRAAREAIANAKPQPDRARAAR